MTASDIWARSTANGLLIYDSEDREADFGTYNMIVTGATLKKELNKASALSLTIVRNGNMPKFEPYYSYAQVVVKEDDNTMKRIFFGRLVSLSEDMEGQISMECDGWLSFLQDTIVFPWELPIYSTTDKEYTLDFSQDDKSQNYQKMTIKEYMDMIAVEHNEQIGSTSDPRYLTRVVASDTQSNTDQIFVRDNYATPLSILEDVLVDYYGGYLIAGLEEYSTFDESKFVSDELYDDDRYIEYHKKAEYISGQTQDIVYGVNLLDFSADTEPEDYFTRLFPTGEDDILLNGGKTFLLRMNQDEKIVFDLPKQSYLELAIRAYRRGPIGSAEMSFTITAEDGSEWAVVDHSGSGSGEYRREYTWGGSSPAAGVDNIIEYSADWYVTRFENRSDTVLSKKWTLKADMPFIAKVWYQLVDLSKPGKDEQTPVPPGEVDPAENAGKLIGVDSDNNPYVRSPFIEKDLLPGKMSVLKQQTFEKIRKPKSLYRKADAYLNKYGEHCKPTYSVKAVDMHLIDSTAYPHPFRVGQKLKIIGPESNIPVSSAGVEDVCTSIEYDLFEIGTVSLEIGEPLQTLTKMTGDQNKGRKKS